MSKRTPSPNRPRAESNPLPQAKPNTQRWDEPEGFSFERVGETVRRLALASTSALIVARAFYPSEDASTGTGLWWDFLVLVVLGMAIAVSLFQERLKFRVGWIDLFVVALVGLVGASVRMGWEHRPAITMGWEWASLGLIFLLARNLTRSRDEASALTGVWVATAVAVAVYGLYQVAVEIPSLQAQFRLEPDRMLRRMGIEPGSSSAQSFQARLLDSKEPFSTFALANSLAGFIVGPLVILLGIAIENLRPGGREKSAPRALAYPLALLPILALLVCLLLTKSRSAWLGLGAGSAVLVIRAWARISRRSLLIACGLALSALVGLVVVGLATRQLDREVLTEATKSFKYRLEWWQGTWDLLNNRDVPFEPKMNTPLGGELLAQADTVRPEAAAFWKGLGPANFAGPYLRHKLPESSEEIQDPHNLFFEVWATAGLPAMVMLALVIGLGLIVMLRPEKGVDEPSTSSTDGTGAARWILAGGFAGWVLIALTGRLDPFKGDLFARWFVLGAAWLLAIGFGAPLWNRQRLSPAVLGAALIAMLVNLLAAGGIGVPSVALSFWLPIAMGTSMREDRASGRLRDQPGLWPGVVLAIGWAALVGAFYGSVAPHWKSEAAIARGDALGMAVTPAFEQARRQYLDAISFDRFNSIPFVNLAGLEFRYWTSPEGRNHPDHWMNLFQTLDKAVQPPLRNPDSLAVRRFQASLAREVLQRLPDPKAPELLFLRKQIAQAARNQARLYPTSAEIRAQLAFASADLGFFDDAIEEAEIALKLDQITPHSDKKLSSRVKQQLLGAMTTWSESKKSATELREKGTKK